MQWILMLILIALPVPALLGSIILENDSIEAIFNENSGALEQLISKKDGWQIQKRPELGQSFRLDVPLPDQRFNPVLGAEQASPEVRVEKGGKRIRFIWKKLRSKNGGILEIDFIGTADLTDDGLIFTGEIHNRSAYPVETVYWPILGDLTRPPLPVCFAGLGWNTAG